MMFSRITAIHAFNQPLSVRDNRATTIGINHVQFSQHDNKYIYKSYVNSHHSEHQDQIKNVPKPQVKGLFLSLPAQETKQSSTR